MYQKWCMMLILMFCFWKNDVWCFIFGVILHHFSSLVKAHLKPSKKPSVVSLSHATPAPDKFDVEPVKKLTLADLRAIGTESRCGPTMFDKMRLDLNSMSVKCESPTKSNTFCKFVCLSDQQMFLPGSIHNVQVCYPSSDNRKFQTKSTYIYFFDSHIQYFGTVRSINRLENDLVFEYA